MVSLLERPGTAPWLRVLQPKRPWVHCPSDGLVDGYEVGVLVDHSCVGISQFFFKAPLGGSVCLLFAPQMSCLHASL